MTIIKRPLPHPADPLRCQLNLFIAIMLGVGLSLLLYGCTGAPAVQATPTPPPTEVPAPPATPLPTATPEAIDSFLVVPLWTATPTPPGSRPSFASPRVSIIQVDKEAEVVDLYKTGDPPEGLSGWVLMSEEGGEQCWLNGVIEPGETLRVWTLQRDRGKGGYNCGFGEEMWNDTEPDTALLFDADGREVDRYPKRPS